MLYPLKYPQSGPKKTSFGLLTQFRHKEYTWNLDAEQLCKENLVIAFDQRGHGQSEQPDTGYDMITMAEDVIHAMAALGLGQVVLVGHGWGARIALVLAARHPALLSHLIL